MDENENRYQTLTKKIALFENSLDCSGDGICDWNVSSGKVYYSKYWKTILGFDENEMSNSFDEWKNRIHPNDIEEIKEKINKYFKGEESNYNCEYRIKCKGGSYKWILDRGKITSKDANGKPERIVSIYTDITEKKEEEKRLQNNEIWKNIVDHSPGMSFQGYTKEGEIIYWNQAAENLYGYTESEALGKNLCDLIMPDKMHPLWVKNYEMRKNITKSGKFLPSDELELLHKDGHIVHVFSTHTAVCLKDKEPIFFCIDINLTDRKKAEKALQESEQRLKLALEGANEGLWDLNFETNQLYFNDSWLKKLGYTQREITGDFSSIKHRVHMDDIPNARKLFIAHLKEETSYYESELRMKTKFGKWTWMLVHGRVVERNNNGKALRAIGTLLDITDRRNLMNELKESEEKFREIYDESPIGISLFDPSVKLVDGNPAFFEMFGISNKKDLELFNPFNAFPFINKNKNKILKGEKFTLETELDFEKIQEQKIFQTSKTNKTTFDCSITPLHASDKTLKGFLVQFQDITEKKEAENKLHNAYEKLEDNATKLALAERLSAIGENTAALTHEINNPTSNIMNIIDGLLNRLYKGESLGREDIIKSLELADREVERIADITSRFLGFARPYELSKVPCYIEDLLLDVVEMRKNVIKNMGVNIYLKLENEWNVVMGNKGRFKQAFLNSIMNAVEAMKYSKIRNLTLRSERIAAKDSSEFVRISISDTGCGIPEKNIKKIWKPFTSKGIDGMGTGVGLSIIKDVVIEHNGRVEIESEVGSGTTFIIEFPVTPKESPIIKNFVIEALNNIYGSLWHDLNNSMAAYGYLEIILNTPNLSSNFNKKLNFINVKAGEIISLLRVIQQDSKNLQEEVVLRKISMNLSEIKPVLRDCLFDIDSNINKDEFNCLHNMDKGFINAEERINDSSYLLSLSDLYKNKSESIDIIKILEELIQEFKISKRFFPQHQISIDYIEKLFPDKKIFIKADRFSFIFTLYNILTLTMKKNNFQIELKKPPEKLLRILIDRNSRTGEIIISLKFNYFLFNSNQLKNIEMETGEKNSAILLWEEEKSNPLAVSRKLLASFAGRMKLQNNGIGAMIILFIPYYRYEEYNNFNELEFGSKKIKDKSIQNINKSESGNNRKDQPNILVADDEPLQRDIFKYLLENEGYNVWFAKNGQEAFNILENSKKNNLEFHLAIFDVTMPPERGSDIIDGLMLSQRVREKGYKLPILISTGHAIGDPHFANFEQRKIISGILSKTLRMDEKLLKINQILKLTSKSSIKSKTM